MTLIDEREVYYEQEKKRKVFKTLITTIIILMIIAIILLIFVKIKESRKFKIYVDGNEISDIDNNILLKDEKGKIYENDGKIYFSIRDLSNLLGRQYYNSEYKKKGEDKTRCQIRNENEYTSFISDSSNIYKAIVPVQNDNEDNHEDEYEIIPSVEYEYFNLDNSVKYINEKIYADTDAVELAFNVAISYDSKKKKLVISSLDYLENEVAKKIRSDVVDSSEYDYTNKRLFKYGMCIVKDAEGNFGVGSYTNKDKLGTYVASCKYSSIKFNEAQKTLNVVTSNDNKEGILFLDIKNQEVINNIASQYDKIECVDNNFKYFITKSQEKYGVMDIDGKIILNNEFDEIGIEDGLYTDVSNKYILDNKYIPVKQNGLWGLYNIDGEVLIEPQYKEFGCTLAQSGESVAIIPNIVENTDGAVFLYNAEKKLYGVYNIETGEKIAISLIEVFKKIESANDKYYINYVIDRDSSVVHTLDVYTDL